MPPQGGTPFQGQESGNQAKGGSGMAVASMVLGILSLVLSCCVPIVPFVMAVLSVILGGVSLKGRRNGKGMAVAGLVCSIISLIPAIFMLVTGAAILGEAGVQNLPF